MAFILFFLQIIRSGLSAWVWFLVVLRIIVFERSLFDFIYILRIGFVGVLVFVIMKTKREGSLFSKLRKLRPLNLPLNLT